MGEFLEANCPSVRVKMVIKHKKEWSEFLDAVRFAFCMLKPFRPAAPMGLPEDHAP